ncbi:hypothetical protein P8452_12577 [Trifolium repens]|nr:hypothetical protein P8452_12577 [Trifolium repens]
MISLIVRSLILATLTPIGEGPPSASSGANSSNPLPVAPNKKNSASKYSKLSGNSRKSTSNIDIVSLVVATLIMRKASKTTIEVVTVEM